MSYSIHGGTIVFNVGTWEQWTSPDPDHEALLLAEWRARHLREKLTDEDLLRLATAADAYRHFAGYEGTTSGVLAQLRELRAAVREERRLKREAADNPTRTT